MGSADSDKDAFDWEKPQHKVNLDEYFISKYTVTNAQFAAFVNATGYKTTVEQQGSSIAYNGSTWVSTKGADWRHPTGPGSSIDGRDNYPVVQVSWDDAVAFCKWASQLTGRKIQLPSEAQWEKAARGTDGWLYPWGNQAPQPDQLNFNNNVKDITPVGKYSPQGDSPYGVADMAGNIWEWTSSLWGTDQNKQTFGYPYKADDGREDPASRDLRILRGGGFDNGPKGVRSAYRGRNPPLVGFGDRGFRVVTFPS
jgi:serine/threonine-protein kinase